MYLEKGYFVTLRLHDSTDKFAAKATLYRPMCESQRQERKALSITMRNALVVSDREVGNGATLRESRCERQLRTCTPVVKGNHT